MTSAVRWLMMCALAVGAPMALLWNGRTWHVMPTTSLPRGQLGAVSCASASFCIATSFSTAAKWDGQSWQPTAIPAPAGSFVELSGVSCTSSEGCMAVGNIAPDVHASLRTFAAELNGTAWRTLTTPNLSASNNAVSAVSCTRLGCMAVGGYEDSKGVGHNLALRWTGTRWRIVKISGPPGLQSVSCPAASGCMAVGQARTLTMAEIWNGLLWRLLRTPNP